MLKNRFSDRMGSFRRPVLILLAAAFAVFLVLLNRVEKPELVTTVGRTFERARVVEVLKDNLEENGRRYGEQEVRLLMLTGPKKGQTIDATSSAGYLFGAGCTPGMKVIVIQSVSGDITVTSVYSADREAAVCIFAGLFFLLICLIGGMKGIKASVGLIFTFVCIIFLYIPLIFRGFSPFWAAVLVAAVTTFVTIYLIGGPTRKTACAIIGTVSGVVVAGAAATMFGYFSGISGYNVPDIESLLFLEQNTKIRIGGLLFSGLLIASLGAVMDVAMSVSSTVEEIHRKKPTLSRAELFRSGMRVGRDMMGTMSNTLILAFAGTSISMLVTNYVYDLPYLQIINSYNIGIEIMQGISGSMGVILAVPISAAVAAFFMAGPVYTEIEAEPELLPPEESPIGTPALPADEKIGFFADGKTEFQKKTPFYGGIAKSATGLFPSGRFYSFVRQHGKLLFVLLCMSVLVYCASRFYLIFTAYAQGDREYTKLARSMQNAQIFGSAPEEEPQDVPAPPAAETVRKDEFRFDFAALHAQNSDFIGWLRLPGTRLSYPVVQGEDNEFYLTHTFSKEQNKMGALFLDSRIGSGLKAENAIVYGHNMRNGSMFNCLLGYLDKEFYDEHPALLLYTEGGMKECSIFSVYKAAPDSDVYRYDFADKAEYGKYLEKVAVLSLYDTGIKPSADERILTLSTCVGDGRDMRFIVHAIAGA